MTRILFGVFLLAHGVIHLGWLTPKPADPKYPFAWRSPWLPGASEATLKGIGTATIALLLLAYVVAALGLWGVPVLSQVWGAAAVLGSVLSIMVTVLLWHPWFVAGPIIDVAIVAVVLLGWIR
jgi:hypothetical protein